jgi:hypothetical protein
MIASGCQSPARHVEHSRSAVRVLRPGPLYRLIHGSWGRLLLIVVLVLLHCGCRPDRTRRTAYFGPTDDIYGVIEDINRNNARLETLWARGRYSAVVRETTARGQVRTHNVSGPLRLLYRRENEVRMVGETFAIGRVFDLGSNEDNYWLIVQPADAMWHGSYAAGATAELDQVPIRPDLILEVLGVSTIDTDLNRQPVPVMRFNNDEDAYMFVWHVQLRDRWIAQKEIWYDRQTRLPRLVNLFDEHGRVVLRAYLTNHQRVRAEEGGEAPEARIASEYDLFFPDTGTRMAMRLTTLRDSYEGLPDDLTFAFPGPQRAGVSNVISVDQHAP